MTQRWSKQALEQSDVVPGQHLTAPGTGSWMVWRHPFTTDTAGLSVAMARKLLVMRWCILSVNMNCTSSEWRSTKKRWKNGCIHTSTRRSFKDLHLSRKQLRHRKEITWAAITENISLHCFYLCKTRVGQFDRLSKEETNVVAGERERDCWLCCHAQAIHFKHLVGDQDIRITKPMVDRLRFPVSLSAEKEKKNRASAAAAAAFNWHSTTYSSLWQKKKSWNCMLSTTQMNWSNSCTRLAEIIL